MRVPEDARLEVKFITRVHEIQRLKVWLKMHPADFYVPYPDRRVNNVYFDTVDFDAYGENLSGSSSRAKLRYRWYGDEKLPDKGVLELKLKRNLFGWKKRLSVPEAPFAAGDRWSTFRSNIKKYSDFSWRFALQTRPIQAMINRYSREYYVSRDDKVRFTIDYDQEAYDQWYKSYPNITRRASIPNIVIVECKFAREDRDLAARIIQSMPIRVGRCSKYMLAIKAMHTY